MYMQDKSMCGLLFSKHLNVVRLCILTLALQKVSLFRRLLFPFKACLCELLGNLMYFFDIPNIIVNVNKR